MILFLAGFAVGSIGMALALCLCRAASVGDDGWGDAESIRRHAELRRELGRCRR